MDNTEKVENAINQYLDTEDASYLDKVMGTVGTEPFGDSDLGYCIARGNLADVIGRIKKITNFSDLLAEEIKLSDLEPKEQLEMTDKTVVTEKSSNEIEDKDGLVTEEFSDATAEEGAIGNEITDGDTPKEQLELDDKVLINKNADVDDNEDFVVAEFSDLNFSDDEDALPTIETTKDTLSQVTEILNIAKELKELEANGADVEVDEESTETDDEDLASDDIEDDIEEDEDLESEEFSMKDKFRNNVNELISKNFSSDKLNPGKALRLGAAYVSDRKRFKNLCDRYELNAIERAKIENLLSDENFSEHNFDDIEKSRAEIDQALAQKRIDEGKGSAKSNYIEDQLETVKKYDKPSLLGGSEDAKKMRAGLEREKQALANGNDTKFWQDYKARADEEVERQKKSDSELAQVAQTINSSFKDSFRNNLKKELNIK